jgi:uncharacterized protein YjbI with pentapeptide repeats
MGLALRAPLSEKCPQREFALDVEGVTVNWLTCRVTQRDGAECVGVQVAPENRCWHHLSSEGLEKALASLNPGDMLDLRGTVVDTRLLTQILNRFYDPKDGWFRVGGGQFDRAVFGMDSSFDNVRFTSGASFRDTAFNAVTFRHTQFNGAVFTGSKFAGLAQFNETRFQSRVKFKFTRFAGSAWFTDAEFAGEALFQGTEFHADAKFDGTKFVTFEGRSHGSYVERAERARGEPYDQVVFDGAKFARPATFMDTRFMVTTSFKWVRFAQGANFSAARFAGDATFTNVQFGSRDYPEPPVQFEDAVFDSNATFSVITFDNSVSFQAVRAAKQFTLEDFSVGGTLILRKALLAGEVRVSAAAPAVDCEGADFRGRVSFKLKRGHVWLTDSAFAAPATLESAPHLVLSVPVLNLNETPKVVPDSGPAGGVVLRSLRGVDAEHLTLVGVDLSWCEFSGLRRPELLRLEGGCSFAFAPTGWRLRWRCVPWRWARREVLYEERVWRIHASAPGWSEIPLPGPFPKPGGPHLGPTRLQQPYVPPLAPVINADQLAVLYRQLRRSVETARDEPGAADLYYGEMEMRRRRKSASWWERALLGVYWLVSGYGLRASRALVALGGVVLVAALVLELWGFPSQVYRHGHTAGFLDCVLYAAGSVVSINLVGGHIPEVLSDWGDVVRLVLRIAGPVLLGLAALAVRGRVKR